MTGEPKANFNQMLVLKDFWLLSKIFILTFQKF